MSILSNVSLAVIGFATIASVSSQASAALVIDDFNSYANFQGLGTSTSSTPYLRFGNAVADAFTATTNPSFVIDGAASGRIPLSYAAGATNASVRRNYAADPQDFSSFDFLTVKIKSTNAATTANVRLSFTNGSAIYQSVASQAVTGTATTYTFNLNPTDMASVGAAGTFDSTLAGVTAIGFRFENTTGSASETMVIDDIILDNVSVPEPTSLGMLGLAGAGLLARRRKA